VKDAITYTEHARMKTVSEKAVRYALERHTSIFSKKILGSPPSRRCGSYKTHIRKSRGGKSPKSKSRKRKTSRATSLVRKIQFYQRQHDCLHLPKRAVQGIIRKISDDFKTDLRWNAKALDLLHYALELYLEAVFKTLGFLSIHRGGRGVVSQKDFEAIKVIEELAGEFKLVGNQYNKY
jgi:histone H3